MMDSNLFEVPAYTMSLLRPHPVVARVVEFNEYVVFWNGVIVPYAAALYLANRQGNVYPTPAVRQRIGDSFRRLRHTGALRKRQDSPIILSDVWQADPIKGYDLALRPHIDQLMQIHTTAEIFAMLDIDKAHDISLYQK